MEHGFEGRHRRTDRIRDRGFGELYRQWILTRDANDCEADGIFVNPIRGGHRSFTDDQIRTIQRQWIVGLIEIKGQMPEAKNA